MTLTGPTPTDRPRRFATATNLVAIAALLVASGAIRLWQDYRMAAAAQAATVAPLKLADLPPRFGTWKAVGADISMDTKTIQIAGCSDYVTRMYTDERTGVVVTALIAYGPAEKLVSHSPAVCYPAVGFQREAGPVDRQIDAANMKPLLRSFVFTKTESQSTQRLHVYAAFRHAGRWTPDSQDSRKRFRHEPGMFKIQIQRPLGAAELCEPGNPIEQFAAALISELEQELVGPEGKPAASQVASSS